MKKVGILLIVISLLLIGIGIVVFSDNFFQKRKVDDTGKTEPVKIVGTYKDLLQNLLRWGSYIYNRNEYLSFGKKNNIYFISLKELNEKYSYDISIFKDGDGTACDVEESGVYFDVDDVLGLTKGEHYEPISPALVGCFPLQD